MNNKGKYKVLAIPDLQEPFAHRDTIAFLKWVKAKESPDIIVNLGDEADMHALSDYDHDPDGHSAGTELEKAIEKLKEHYELFPTTYVCTSNHTARPLRRASKYGIPKAFLRDYHEFLKAPKGWKWAEQWEFDGVIYEHGEGFSGRNGAINCADKNAKPTVIGHLHSHAGIQYSANASYLLYGFNVGCLIDRQAYAFRYGKNMRHKPILGCGIIEKGIPKFIPMLLDHNGRWLKR